MGDCWVSGAWTANAWQAGSWCPSSPIPPIPVVVQEQRRWPGPSTVIYREGEIGYWWERRQRIEDEEIILL